MTAGEARDEVEEEEEARRLSANVAFPPLLGPSLFLAGHHL